jgi:hypothetical protein
MRLCSSASRLKKAPRHTPAVSPVSAASPAVAASAMPRRPGCSTVKGCQTARPDAGSCAPGCDACDTTRLRERRSAQASAAQAAPLPRARRCCAHELSRLSEGRGVRAAAAQQQRASSAAARAAALAAAAAQPPAQARRRRPRHDAARMKRPAAEHGRQQAHGQRAAWRRSEPTAACATGVTRCAPRQPRRRRAEWRRQAPATPRAGAARGSRVAERRRAGSTAVRNADACAAKRTPHARAARAAGHRAAVRDGARARRGG